MPVRPRSADHTLPIWLVAVGVAMAAWVVITRAGDGWPHDIHLRDDAYYYFVWARSVVEGQGPCVTPDVPTSGVHLAWALMLTAAAWMFGAASLPSIAVGLGITLHLLTALAIRRAAGPDGRLGWLAASVYAGSSFLAIEARNGQETALGCFALAVLCINYRRSARAFFFAALFVVAARSDLIFFVAALALVEPKWRAARLLLTAVVLGCYAGWNLLLAGHWLQDSAGPIPWLFAQEWEHAGTGYFERVAPHLRGIVLGVPWRLSSTAMAAAWVAVVVWSFRRREYGFPWLFVGGLGLVVFHDLWREYPRDYYFAPLGVVGGLAAIRLVQLAPRLGVVMLALGVVWNGSHAFDAAPTIPAQREMAMAGRFVHRFLPSEVRLGCFNAGLVTWESRHQVFNLDGVVNAPAFDALRDGDLLAYLERNDIRYLVDNPVQFASAGLHSCGRHFGGGFAANSHLRERVRFVWPGTEADRGRPGIEHFSLYTRRRAFVFDMPWLDVGARRSEQPLTDLGPAPGGGRFVAWAARAGQRLRAGDVALLSCVKDLTYVLEVAWPSSGPLRLFVDESEQVSEQPVFEIASR